MNGRMALTDVPNPLAGMQWRGREGQEGKRGNKREKQNKKVKVKWVDWSLGERGRWEVSQSRAGMSQCGSKASLTSLVCDSPHCGSPGLGGSFWVAPPAMSLLIKYVLKVRLLVATMSHL